MLVGSVPDNKIIREALGKALFECMKVHNNNPYKDVSAFYLTREEYRALYPILCSHVTFTAYLSDIVYKCEYMGKSYTKVGRIFFTDIYEEI